MSSQEISRRRMLKGIGAGTAVVWSAPILRSLRTPAFAQYGACSPVESCLSCPDNPICEPFPPTPHCGGSADCGSPDFCGCVQTVEGPSACVANRRGSGPYPCGGYNPCLPGEACVATCSSLCDPAFPECRPLCGTA